MSRPAILCVDDERTVLVALKEQLRRAFGGTHLIEVADSGELALEILEDLREEGVDVPVVISDHIMPGLKGDALLARIQERNPEIVKIMLTGQASADAVGNAINAARLYRYIAKPWDEADMVLTIRSGLEAYASARALEAQQATLRRVNELALDLTSNLAGRDRHERLVERVGVALGVDRIALFGWDGQRLRRLATHGGRPDDTPRVIRPDSCDELPPLLDRGGLGRGGTPDDRGRCLAEAFGWSDLGSGVVGLALQAANEVIGLLALGSRDPRTLADEDRLHAFGALAAASVRTARLIDALEQTSAQKTQLAGALLRAADERSTGPLHGTSPALRSTLAALNRTAADRRPLLLIGAPGTGREAAARHVHRMGPGAEGPFIRVTGAAVQGPAELDRGRSGDPGPFELAAGGTLFVAGVDRLSRRSQAVLARSIRSAASEGKGVRVILSPSSGDGSRLAGNLVPELLALVGEQSVSLPLLRDRTEDIPTLADFYLRAHAIRLGRTVERLEDGALERLAAYPWPGNVRELERVIERAVLTADGTVARLAPDVFDASERMGSYRLTERLGAGGMGEVWKAEHEHLARPAAVKLIKTTRTLSPATRDEALERFRREAAATALLRSPHTVELYDFGISETGDLYYVMELLEGIDLQTLVQRHGAMPPERVVYLLRQACHSLIEAHERGLVHRDIKPANLVVCRLGPDHDVLKVLDFGMVHGQDPQATALTQPGHLAGSPVTMSPEATRGEVEARSDLYSLGCTAYFLLTGRHVFQSALPALLLEHATSPPPPLTDAAPVPVPEALEAAVMACLAKTPNERPPTARALRRLLDEVVFEDPWTLDRAEAWWSAHEGASVVGGVESHLTL